MAGAWIVARNSLLKFWRFSFRTAHTINCDKLILCPVRKENLQEKLLVQSSWEQKRAEQPRRLKGRRWCPGLAHLTNYSISIAQHVKTRSGKHNWWQHPWLSSKETVEWECCGGNSYRKVKVTQGKDYRAKLRVLSRIETTWWCVWEAGHKRCTPPQIISSRDDIHAV